MFWKRKKEVVTIVVPYVREHQELPEEHLRQYVEQLTKDRNWQYLEELAYRKKDQVVAQMASSNEPSDMFRAQGLIKMYDWLSKLKHNVVYNPKSGITG
jgi:hypothetical protein